MSIKSVNPYLDLRGKADEAIEFYKRALGAKLVSLMRFGDSMHDCPAALKEQVMHAVLDVDGSIFFLADGSPENRPQTGGTVNVALDFDSDSHARECFEAMSQGATVFQPIMEAPWGLFGALQDRFGINWMFNKSKA